MKLQTVASKAKRKATPTTRACKRIEENAQSAFSIAVDSLNAIRAGKLTETEGKLAVGALGQAVKALNADVQNRHAEQTHIKQAMQLAAVDRDLIPGYTGLQATLVVAAMETLEERDPAPMQKLAAA